MTIKKASFTLLSSALITINLNARDQIKIVGSSTVYPFASAVAKKLDETTNYPIPIIISTGSGEGYKLFCKGNNLNTPDIINASRRMKKEEFRICEKNGITNITEAIIGFDGIIFAQSNENKPFSITTKQLALAIADEVPNKNDKLIKNPYKRWSQVHPSLPNREILIYGPPKSSGTRDTFEDIILKATFKNMNAYISLYNKDKNRYKAYKEYHKIRQDGVYISSGEDDNIIVEKLIKMKNAFGIFGYSFLAKNKDKLIGTKIDGIMPTSKTISSGEYPISRSLYFYIKNSHEKDVPAMKKYIELFMSDKMTGGKGILNKIGLITLPKNKRESVKVSVKKRVKVSIDILK
ncbi:phosphate-binding protein [Malaciobacter molluscorum]|uniref:substrate-binding domain-containing protein n=1 Tax=Malaciobacter molluscorum TaxID=1032072 RepID=UPI00100B450E|nr:substrate-binding domain-containing protein [Malaciobacter molluscorum]RXJ92168.1 phosphate-binding protein [Malaciobacter molluscorum]